MNRLIKIWWCVLFHKKEIKDAQVNDGMFTFDMGTFKGCSRCDIWQQIIPVTRGKASCCSVHTGGDEECN